MRARLDAPVSSLASGNSSNVTSLGPQRKPPGGVTETLHRGPPGQGIKGARHRCSQQLQPHQRTTPLWTAREACDGVGGVGVLR